MDEKEKEQGTLEDSKEGVQSKATSELDRADQIAERLKRENDRKDELLSREESLAARKAIGGEIDAGQIPVKKTEDEEWAEDAKERYAGTGMSPVEGDDGK